MTISNLNLILFEIFKCPYEHIPCVKSAYTAIYCREWGLETGDLRIVGYTNKVLRVETNAQRFIKSKLVGW